MSGEEKRSQPCGLLWWAAHMMCDPLSKHVIHCAAHLLGNVSGLGLALLRVMCSALTPACTLGRARLLLLCQLHMVAASDEV